MSSGLIERPLELIDGMAISREDFYAITDESDRYRNVERIDGKVVMNAASVRREQHGLPHGQIIGLLAMYYAETPGTEIGDNGTAQIEDEHDPQPDAYLLILPENGGQVRFTGDDYIRGAPELIVEIAASSLSKDLGRKKEIYEQDGCREYLVWATETTRFHCFRNSDTGFRTLNPDDGVFRSQTFPGLRIDTAALLRGDYRAAMQTLREGLASEEHAAFVAELAERTGP